MRILLVNYYQNQSKFKFFAQKVKEFFKKSQELTNYELIFVERNINDIDDHLHDTQGVYMTTKSGQNFNIIDAVFIEGDFSILPWNKKSYKLNVLVNMCLRTNKRLFASQGAMQSLIYLCATNSEKPLNIINKPINLKEENTESIQNQFQNRLNTISYQDQNGEYDITSQNRVNTQEYENPQKKESLFLNRVCGDLYLYDQEQKKYITWGNVGMHNQKAAEDKINDIGKHVIKPPTYIARGLKEQERYLTGLKESVCQIRPQYMAHYIFNGIEKKQFKISKQSQWEVHPFQFKSNNKKFKVLSDNKVGPQILEFSESIICCSFSIKQSYYETVQILENFIQKQIENFCTYDNQLCIPLQVEKGYNVLKSQFSLPVESSIYDTFNNKTISNQKYNFQQRPQSSKTQILGQNSRDNYSKQHQKNTVMGHYLSQQQQTEPIINDGFLEKKINNCISQAQVSQDNPLQRINKYVFDDTFNKHLKINKQLSIKNINYNTLSKQDQIKINNNKNQNINNMYNRQNSNQSNLTNLKDQQFQNMQQNSYDFNDFNVIDPNYNNNDNDYINSDQLQYPETKGEIKKFLHPERYDNSQDPTQEKIFVPGFLNQNQIREQVQNTNSIKKMQRSRIMSANPYQQNFNQSVQKINQQKTIQRYRIQSLHTQKQRPQSQQIERQITQEQLPYGHQPYQTFASQNFNNIQQPYKNILKNSTKQSVNFQTNDSDFQKVNIRPFSKDSNKRNTVRPVSSGSYVSVNLSTYKYRNENKQQWVGGQWRKF